MTKHLIGENLLKENKMSRMQSKDVQFMLNLIKNPKYKSSKEAIQSLSALRESLKALKLQGIPDTQIFKVKLAAQDAIYADLLTNNALEKAELEKKLNTIKNAYEKDYEKNYETNSRRIEAYKRKINAMTNEELFREAAKVHVSDPLAYLPGELDELSITVKTNIPDKLLELRDVIKDNNLNEPYLHNDIARDIVGDLEYLNNNSKGILIKTEDGRRMMLGLDEINEYIDFEDTGEDE